ncbi:MAG: serine/threonine protein kinase [Coriobacteriales bacterium]|jgi:serine/threonine-protein kinase|nr:serine/threonine protein kinase [Coriobacteriales bacterium]
MLASGTVLDDKYKIEDVVGKGGFGLVYRANDLKLNRIWAVKEIDFDEVDLSSSDLTHDDLIKSFLVEKEILSRLDHPSIVRITDMIQNDDRIYIIMDYVEGESLDKVIQTSGPQRQEDVVDWGIQLCDALDYIHTCTPPIVYRDMKPNNVMLRPDGTVKLIDFGIAREFHPESQNMTISAETKVFRTQGYSSPEQSQGAFEPRSDIYSLGATLYHLVTGKSPAEPPYVVEPIRQVIPSLSAGLETIINRATQQNPANRYATCAEMRYDLERYESVDEAHTRKLRNTWRMFIGLLIATLAFLAAGLGCLFAADAVRSSDYGIWIDRASKESTAQAAREDYLRAIDVDPSRFSAYLGLVELYRDDSSFTYEEEEELLAVITPHLPVLQAQSESYAELAFDIGKLYWYYFDDGTGNSENRIGRIKASRRWMNDAAAIDGFSQAGLVRVYSQIADFNNEIVARINEGDDAGIYEPYFRSLEELYAISVNEDNEVIILESAGLIESALYTYPRKFRADGIGQTEMQDLLQRAVAAAASVVATTEKLDAKKAEIERSNAAVIQAIDNAFVDSRPVANAGQEGYQR